MSRDRSKDRPKTAAELLKDLQQDPEHIARMQSLEQQRLEASQLYAMAAEPVLSDLEEDGFHVRTVGDLRLRGKIYQKAIPTLLRWLPVVSYLPLKEDIVRTLSVPWAKPVATRVLIEEFKRPEQPEGLRWAIANALAILADAEVIDEVLELVRNPAYGRAREMLPIALANTGASRAVFALITLLENEDIAGHAAMALGQLGDAAALPALTHLSAHHPKEWVRSEAQKSLAKIKSELSSPE